MLDELELDDEVVVVLRVGFFDEVDDFFDDDFVLSDDAADLLPPPPQAARIMTAASSNAKMARRVERDVGVRGKAEPFSNCVTGHRFAPSGADMLASDDRAHNDLIGWFRARVPH